MFLPNADAMNQHFEMFLPDDLNLTDAKKTEAANMMRKFYLDDKPLTPESKAEFIKVRTCTRKLKFVVGLVGHI